MSRTRSLTRRGASGRRTSGSHLVRSEGHHVRDLRRAAREGDQPIETEGIPAARGYPREIVEESLVDGIDWELSFGPLRPVAEETFALLECVYQFAEAVAELDPCDVELESLRYERIAGLHTRERRLRGRVVDEEDAAVQAFETGLDGLHELTKVTCLVLCRGGDGRALRPSREARERVAHREPLERRMYVDDPLSESDRTPGNLGHELLGVAHHVLDARVRAVPLEHGELGVVAAADLAAAKARRDLVDTRPAVRQQPLHLVLRRRNEPPRRTAVAARDLERVEVHVEPRRRDHQGRLNLDKAACVEEAPSARTHAGAFAQILHRASSGARPRRTICASCPDARDRPPRSALPSAQVIAIPSRAPNIARATRCGDTSPRSSPVAWPSDTTRAIESR